MEIAKSVLFFFLAGICELGGAYLIWLWLKNGRSFLFGIAGAAVLVAYGFMHTMQTSNYGRIQAHTADSLSFSPFFGLAGG